MAKEQELRNEGSRSNPQVMEAIWKNIWNVKGSRVVKMFLCQACNDILPTKERLFKRHITLDPLCSICGLETETLRHILWSCPFAKDVWLEYDPQIQKSTSDVNDFILIF